MNTNYSFYVYIMTNMKNGTIYTGVTNSIVRRALEHKSGEVEGFTKHYDLHLLVYYETFVSIDKAIKREKEIKGKSRIYKIELIEKKNPKWGDLASEWTFHDRAPRFK